MKKVGILTMYNNSNNYGGVLQAYALQKAIEKLGYKCEQISFRKTTQKKLTNNLKNRVETNGILEVCSWAIKRSNKVIVSKIAKKLYSKKYEEEILERKEKFKRYRDSIPHSCEYYSENIEESLKNYDIYVCGSDQIWKPGVVCKEYLLEFVPDNKYKFSYAASISKNILSLDEREYLIKGINRLDCVSLRESQTVEVIQQFTDKKIESVLDPTLLISKEEWEKQCGVVKVNEKYIFCYLLGFDKKQRDIIKKLALKTKMKIVTIPFADGKYNFMDNDFGDIKLCSAGPGEFLTLIKNAELVITDSFHATVFSNIFETDFYVLGRTEEPAMNTRIISLLDMFNLQERLLYVADELLNWKPIDFTKRKRYDKELKKSEEYLVNALAERNK